MNTTAYTGSSKGCPSAMPSITRSVIVVIVCFENLRAVNLGQVGDLPVRQPFADREITVS